MDEQPELWKQPLIRQAAPVEQARSVKEQRAVTPDAPPDVQIELPLLDRREVAEAFVARTLEEVREQGFCLWRVPQWDSGVVCVVENADVETVVGEHSTVSREAVVAAFRYPVYTLCELRELGKSGSDDWLIYRLKLIEPAARVIDVRRKATNGEPTEA